MEYLKVNKEQFEDFISKYPNKIDFECTGISDPPFVSVNDFSLGVWPDSVIASYYKIDSRGGDADYKILKIDL